VNAIFICYHHSQILNIARFSKDMLSLCSLLSLFWRNQRNIMWSPCCLCVFHKLMKARIVEPEDTTITILYKHLCDMTPGRQNSAVREAPRRRPLLGNSLVIRSSNSWVSACCNWWLTTVLSSDLSSLYNFWLDCRENAVSNSFSVVSILSLCVCIPPHPCYATAR
jgi:hypothetical protein